MGIMHYTSYLYYHYFLYPSVVCVIHCTVQISFSVLQSEELVLELFPKKMVELGKLLEVCHQCAICVSSSDMIICVVTLVCIHTCWLIPSYVILTVYCPN